MSACPASPLPVQAGGQQVWSGDHSFGSVVQYLCNDGISISYGVCAGGQWSYPQGGYPSCHDQSQSPQCIVEITEELYGLLSSIDGLYQGCKVIIRNTGQDIHLTATKFKVRRDCVPITCLVLSCLV